MSTKKTRVAIRRIISMIGSRFMRTFCTHKGYEYLFLEYGYRSNQNGYKHKEYGYRLKENSDT